MLPSNAHPNSFAKFSFANAIRSKTTLHDCSIISTAFGSQ
jgi:hypothetical protein